jgi:hypothetical protein
MFLFSTSDILAVNPDVMAEETGEPNFFKNRENIVSFNLTDNCEPTREEMT